MSGLHRQRRSAAERPLALSTFLTVALALAALAGATAPPAQAAVLLETIPVKAALRRRATTAPSSARRGSTWTATVYTRNDMLNRDLTDITYVTSVPCTVASGTLADPYTAITIAFLRGVGTSDAVQIDHVVALSDTWQTGAQQLTYEQRVALANDPLNLQSTDRHELRDGP